MKSPDKVPKYLFKMSYLIVNDEPSKISTKMKTKLSGSMKTVQILYGISFIGFVFRTMHYLVVLEKFGEKIMVLQKLVWDIVVFGVLFFGFALSYGVLTQASFKFNY